MKEMKGKMPKNMPPSEKEMKAMKKKEHKDGDMDMEKMMRDGCERMSMDKVK